MEDWDLQSPRWARLGECPVRQQETLTLPVSVRAEITQDLCECCEAVSPQQDLFMQHMAVYRWVHAG